MNRIRAFAAFWYDFVVGDDWHTTVGLGTALAATAALAHEGINAWWLTPACIIGLLGLSLRRTVKASRKA